MDPVSSAASGSSSSSNNAMAAGERSPDELERLARAALPLLEAAGDHRGLAQVWYALGYGVANSRCRFEDWAFAAEQAIRQARLDVPQNPFHFGLPAALTNGPRPAGEALETLDSLLPERRDPLTMGRRAVLLAMLDQIAEAQELAAAADERERELSDQAGHAALDLSEVAELAGDEEAAAQYLRRLCAYLEATGQRAALSSFAPQLGRALCALGRYEEAEPLAEQGRQLGDPEDAAALAERKGTRARPARQARRSGPTRTRSSRHRRANRFALAPSRRLLRSSRGARSSRPPRRSRLRTARSTRPLRTETDHPPGPPGSRATRLGRSVAH